ncbi:MAG: hypothetical protein WBG08_11775 [Litorimonas sp.]
MTETPKPEDMQAFCNALPDNITADHAEGNTAVPRSLSKELGDYAEGDYAVSANTKDAPTMEESDFNDTVKAHL